MADSDTEISAGIEKLARLGYGAKGTLYLLVGVFTALAVFGASTGAMGMQEAILKVASQPSGTALLVLLGIGLLGHVLWRLTQALADPEHKGRGPKGVLRRLGMLLSGLIYLSLAFTVAKLILNSGGGGSSPEQQSAEAMSYPGGLYVVAAVGAGFIGVGLYQIRRAFKASFRKHWKTYEMSARQVRLATLSGKVGLTARAVVFLIIGIYLIVAAWTHDPDKARGMQGALLTLADQPLGQWLLVVIALGLVCYGVYCFCNAWFREVKPDDA